MPVMPQRTDGPTVPMHGLKAWREHRKLTQEQLANILGIGHSNVSRWETGGHGLRTKRLRQLAEIYGITVEQLLAGPQMTEQLAAARRLLERLPADKAATWLAAGEAMLPPEPAPPSPPPHKARR